MDELRSSRRWLRYEGILDTCFLTRTSCNKQAVCFGHMGGSLEVCDALSFATLQLIDLREFSPHGFFDRFDLPEHFNNAHARDHTVFQLRRLVVAGDSRFNLVAVAVATASTLTLIRKSQVPYVVRDRFKHQPISAVSICPDATLVATGDHDSVCNIFDARSLERVASFNGHVDVEQGLHIEWIEFSLDLTCVASVNEGLCAVWEPLTARVIAETEGCSFARFSPDGRSVLVTDRKRCVNWMFRDRRMISYAGHTASVTSADWSPSGHHVASGDFNGEVHVWDPATGDTVDRIIDGATSPVLDLCWIAAGIVVLCDNGVVAVMSEATN